MVCSFRSIGARLAARGAMRLCAAAAATGLLASQAWSTDWYVDALHGSDASNGTTAATAWRTITRALASVSGASSQQRILVAPGTYDAALGESYPFVMQPKVRIIGTGASAATVLDASGADVLVFSGTGVNGYVFGAESGAEGLTLRHGNTGIWIGAHVQPGPATPNNTFVSPSFRDLVIEDLAGTGVVVGSSGWMFWRGEALPTFEGVRIARCSQGAYVGTGGQQNATPAAVVTFTDCSVRDCTGRGLGVFGGSKAAARAFLTRCRVTGNTGHGVEFSAVGGSNSSFRLVVNASLIAANGGSGVTGTSDYSSWAVVDIFDSTVAHNANFGVQAQHANPSSTLTIANDILFGNATDLSWTGGNFSADSSDCGDGSLAGYAGCIAADPLFVDTAQGDFRLRFGSPCTESGRAASAGGLDLLGTLRPLDGNLDTVAAVDMGAYEFAPLFMRSTGQIGSPLDFELWGEANGSTTLWWTRIAPVAPMTTPLGQLALARDQMAALFTRPTSPWPPTTWHRFVPNSAYLVGHTFGFQALTTSSAAPLGRALSNVVALPIVP